jgi:hypothetical protein
MWKMTSQLYRVTRFLGLIGLLLSVVSIADLGQHPKFFAWLFFYMPVLWLLWICCVLFVRKERSLRQLLILWMIIDIAILMLFLSFSRGLDHWTKANGVDVVLLMTYFPVLVPTNFLMGFFSDNVKFPFTHNLDALIKLFGGGMGDGFACWMIFSGLAALQSLALVGISQLGKTKS